MKSSIRTKLFRGISSLIIFFVFLSWFLNVNFLNRYYIFQKGAALEREYRYIDRIYHGNLNRVRLPLEKIVHTKGINIIILDKNLTVKHTFFPRPPGMPPSPPPQPEKHPVPEFISQTADWSKPAYHVDAPKRTRMRTQFLNFTARLHNGEYLWLGTPLPEVEQSVAISNQFFFMTGILTLLIGGIFIMFYSKKFTRPILELNAMAQNMVKFDFTKTYPVKSRDEIGELGRSFNYLSAQLGKSIRELQQANHQLELDNERQKKIDEIRKEFISNVSHELKTPIALIQGYAEGLLLNINDNEEDKNFYCNVIMDEAVKMNKLVRELLDLSEIDSGYLSLDEEVFDLGELTEHVLEKYHLIFRDKGIKLVFQREGATRVAADISRIDQVLVNYLNNAVSHIAGEKLLQVRVVGQTPSGGACARVRVSVFNTGKTVPEEALEKIWFSFYKVDKARTRAYGGTGLGLAIVRAIIERHRGDYGVANLPDGVEFWFVLQGAAENQDGGGA